MSAADAPPAPPQAVSARRTAAQAFTFSGRATRTEVVGYAIAAALVLLAVSFLTALFANFEIRNLVSNALTLVLAIPVPALLVRRLHDQDRSGTLVWLAAIGFAVWVVRSGVTMALGTEARIGFDRMTWAIDWLVILANLGALLFAILPGTPGPNRFGPNPRQASA